MIDTLNSFAALLGYLTFLLGAVVLGSAGLAAIQNWARKMREPIAATEVAAGFPFCAWDDDRMKCFTHDCSADEQCGKLACPHCLYKFDDEAGAFGYPTEGADPRDPASYGKHVNYNTGEPCPPNCSTPQASCVDNPDCTNGEGGCVPPHCGFPQEQEPVKIRLHRVKAENFAYQMDGSGKVVEAWEMDDDGKVIAHEKLPDPDAYARYENALKGAVERVGLIPHCDSNVLHEPGTCIHCDKYPDLQEFRALHGINFTGQHDPNKLLCPAEVKRPIDTIERWFGNVKGVSGDHTPASSDWCLDRIEPPPTYGPLPRRYREELPEEEHDD